MTSSIIEGWLRIASRDSRMFCGGEEVHEDVQVRHRIDDSTPSSSITHLPDTELEEGRRKYSQISQTPGGYGVALERKDLNVQRS